MKMLAIVIGKMLQIGLRMLGKKGGTLPGLFALRIDSHLLKKLQYPPVMIFVSGTNGKSTATNMLYRVLCANKMRVVSNIEGNNLKTGIVSCLLAHVGLNGNVRADVMLFEVDELTVPRMMEDVTPTHILINNFFRDQLDRAGEMENVIRRMESKLQEFSGILLLNADDPNVARLAEHTKARIHYFGVAQVLAHMHDKEEASEGRFCPRCKKELQYSYYQYSHIGRYHCANDGFGDIKRDTEATVLDIEKGQYQIGQTLYQSPYQTTFAIYNETGVIAMADVLGISKDVQQATITSFRMNNGRMEEFHLRSGQRAILNLAKNPTGFNESMKYIRTQIHNTPCVVGLVLNDLDADGHDVSWIYDARMETLCDSSIQAVVCGGMRYLDMALRIQYSGFAGDIQYVEDLQAFVKQLESYSLPIYIIANYTALQPVRKALGKEVRV